MKTDTDRALIASCSILSPRNEGSLAIGVPRYDSHHSRVWEAHKRRKTRKTGISSKSRATYPCHMSTRNFEFHGNI